MRIFLTAFKKDIRLVLSDIKSVGLLVILPLLFIVLFSYVADTLLEDKQFIKPFAIAVSDGENSVRTRVLIEQLKGTGIFSEVVLTDEKNARDMACSGEVPAAVIIPRGLVSSIASGKNKPVEVVGSSLHPFEARTVYNIIEGASTLVSAGQAAVNTVYHFDREENKESGILEKRFEETVAEVIDIAVSRRRFFSKVPGISRYDVTPEEHFTAAVLSVFLMFTGLPAAKMFISERNSGVYERVVSAAGPVPVIASKIAVGFFLGVVQFSSVLIFSYAVMGAYWQGNPAAAIIITISALFAVSCWSLLVVSLSPTPASADMIGGVGIIIMAVAGGGIYPLYRLPEIMGTVSEYLANRWIAEGYMMVFSDSETTGMLRYAACIMGTGVIFLILALIVEAARSFFKA